MARPSCDYVCCDLHRVRCTNAAVEGGRCSAHSRLPLAEGRAPILTASSLLLARQRLHRALADHRDTAMAWHSTHAWSDPRSMEESFRTCGHHLCRAARETMERVIPE